MFDAAAATAGARLPRLPWIIPSASALSRCHASAR